MNRCYTYLLIDPRDGQPFYVGKGTGNRMYEHRRTRSRLTNEELKQTINELVESGLDIIYEKVLCNVTDEQALKKEIDLIAQYGRRDINTGTLCNMTEGGEGFIGTRLSNEQREQKSRYMKSQPRRLPIKRKPVSQYTLDSEHVKDWNSAKEASDHTPANRSYITQVCKGKRVSAGGFLWTYQGEPAPVFSKQYHQPVSQHSIEGEFVASFRSLTEAQHHTGVEFHNISECCRGKSKTAGGYLWKYIPPQCL